MKNLYFLLILFISFSASKAQSPQKIIDKDIVISQKTFEKLNKKNVNRKKVAINKDKQNKEYVKDNPNSRLEFERKMLINPKTGKIPANIRKKELEYASSHQSGLQSYTKTGSATFENVGPKNVGGRTRALAIDVTNENTILAGGVSGGLWKSTDNGESWRKVTPVDQIQSITGIAQDTRQGHTNIWYYCTGEYTGNSASEHGAHFRGNGLYKSTDNGESWTPISSTASNTPHSYDSSFDYCWNICVNPINGDVYVATANDVQKSTNGGSTWQAVINTEANYNDIICTNSGVLYATASEDGTVSGVFRSTTGNSNDWQTITPSDLPSDYRRMVLAYAPSNENIIYLLAYTPEAGYQGNSFYKLTYNSSSDYNWENRSNNLPITQEPVAGYDAQGSYNMIVKVAPDDENMVFIGGTNLHRSDNGFSSRASTYWIGGYDVDNDISQYPNHHPDVHSLAFKSDNATLLCGHDGGISRSVNFKSTFTSRAVNWVFLNNGYLTTQAYTVSVDPDDYSEKAIVSGFQDNGTWLSSDGLPTSNWSAANSGDGSYCAITNMGTALLTSSQNGRVYADFEDESWTRIDPADAIGQLFINPFITDANSGEILYYAAGSFVWRNSDFTEIPRYSNSKATENWEKLTEATALGTISTLESSVYPAHVLYYGTSLGRIYKMIDSDSENYEATNITSSIMPTGAYISSISSNPRNADEVMISFSSYEVESIFHSSDGGSSWIAISGNLEENGNPQGSGPSVRSVKIVPTPTGTIYYAGTSTGLYKTESLNGGSTNWTQVANQEIGNAVVAMIKSRGDGYVAVGTHANGIYTTDHDFSSSAPIALIGITQDTILPGETVNFKSRSIGEISNYSWTFTGAEANSSSVANPTNIRYNSGGTFPVSLTVSNANGSHTQTIETAIYVNGGNVNFAANRTSANINESINFSDQSTGHPVEWEWTFEGGTTEDNTVRSPNVSYSTAGTYPVSLTITYSNGSAASKTIENYITISDPSDLGEDLLYNVENDEDLSQYRFNGASSWGYVSGHNSYSMTRFAEKFQIQDPNHNVINQIQLIPSRLRANTDNARILLKIWNGNESPDTEIFSQEVPLSSMTRNQLNLFTLSDPVAVDNQFFVGYEIFYENTQNVAVDTFAVYHLPLEDGATSSNTAYLYFNENWLPFSSSNAYGQNSSLAIKAKVANDPAQDLNLTTDFFANTITIIQGTTINFTDNTTGNPTAWSWSFPGADTSSSNEQNPSITYHEPGTYNVSLSTTRGESTSSLTKNAYIVVLPSAEANFTAGNVVIDEGDQVVFIDQSNGAIESWSWSFPGGSSVDPSLQSPTVTYNEEGVYNVSLVVTDYKNNTDTHTEFNFITVRPPLSIDDVNEEKNKVVIYPNPLTDQSHIKFPNKNNSKYRLIVVDSSGKIVRIIDNITTDNILINKEKLNSGVHVVKIKGEKIYKGKLLVK